MCGYTSTHLVGGQPVGAPLDLFLRNGGYNHGWEQEGPNMWILCQVFNHQHGGLQWNKRTAGEDIWFAYETSSKLNTVLKETRRAHSLHHFRNNVWKHWPRSTLHHWHGSSSCGMLNRLLLNTGGQKRQVELRLANCFTVLGPDSNCNPSIAPTLLPSLASTVVIVDSIIQDSQSPPMQPFQQFTVSLEPYCWTSTQLPAVLGMLDTAVVDALLSYNNLSFVAHTCLNITLWSPSQSALSFPMQNITSPLSRCLTAPPNTELNERQLQQGIVSIFAFSL